ncbi:acetylornithine transaminase [Leifsonia virtsii]|uniref:Acetylornithine transaminase n=1 Tax=Leifsonia virtsii TaxID=3035915 RepID=A0ABT8J1T7_9MICO|nr:acetylornithine transaminase [Leifsonia virtsii]MDN4598562.1 acetylornithine transaminase [Leifsonia virtsii]
MSEALNGSRTTTGEVAGAWLDGGWKAPFGDAIMRTLATPKRMLVRGEGCRVWDVDGNEYLDFLAGIAVNALGHAHPALVDAVSAQVATLAHVSNYFSTPSQLELAQRLRVITGAGDRGRVLFGNSGAEANEAAFKLARLNKGPHGRKTRVLALHNAFHGRTMGSLALTGKPPMREAFEPLPGGVEHIDSTIEALEAAIDDRVAALFVEPIKGEAGVLDLPEGFLRRARELTEKHHALLIVDEIQTGVGRTGRWFAYQHADILPDAVTVAKGMAGGVPIGALVTFGWASDLFTQGQHGSTFGGNPLATAAGNAVLAEIERSDLVGNAARRGEELKQLIRSFDSPLIDDVRGHGLLIGIGLTDGEAHRLSDAALANGLIINAPNESSIRLAPPLIVGDAELAEFRERFGRALASL